jgi:hypothetical protein
LLYEFVGPHNPERTENTEYALGQFSNELTKFVIRFLAKLENNSALADPPRELDELGIPTLDLSRVASAKVRSPLPQRAGTELSNQYDFTVCGAFAAQ